MDDTISLLNEAEDRHAFPALHLTRAETPCEEDSAGLSPVSTDTEDSLPESPPRSPEEPIELEVPEVVEEYTVTTTLPDIVWDVGKHELKSFDIGVPYFVYEKENSEELYIHSKDILGVPGSKWTFKHLAMFEKGVKDRYDIDESDVITPTMKLIAVDTLEVCLRKTERNSSDDEDN